MNNNNCLGVKEIRQKCKSFFESYTNRLPKQIKKQRNSQEYQSLCQNEIRKYEKIYIKPKRSVQYNSIQTETNQNDNYINYQRRQSTEPKTYSKKRNHIIQTKILSQMDLFKSCNIDTFNNQKVNIGDIEIQHQQNFEDHKCNFINKENNKQNNVRLPILKKCLLQFDKIEFKISQVFKPHSLEQKNKFLQKSDLMNFKDQFISERNDLIQQFITNIFSIKKKRNNFYQMIQQINYLMNNIIMSSNGSTYALQTQLGSGSFGTVYQVLDLRTNKYYACKIISKGLLYKYNAEPMIRQEIKIQSTLNHKNILKVYHSFEDNQNIYIISEFCSGGSLQTPKTPFQEKDVFNICISILGALDCLHSNKIIHRDLKLENIFLHEDGTYKLGDFGWATYIDKVEPILCGTTEYMPPEVVLKQYHDYKVDCYSLGALIYILLHTHFPFQANSQPDLIAKITSQEVIVNSNINEDLQILIQALLTKDPNDRPTIQQLYLSRWIKSQMKLNNIFNKYENEQLKNKFRNKNITIKTLEVNGSIKSSLSDSQKSSLTHSSSTQISSSNNPCSPIANKGIIDQIFNFKEFDHINSVPQPKLY